MINHIWSILCRRSVIDSETNNISIIDALEQFVIDVQAKSGKKLPNKINIPIDYEVVSFWTKSEVDSYFKGKAKIDIVNPDNKLMKSFEQILEMPKDMKRLRTRVRINGFVAENTGIYRFIISYKHNDKSYKKLVELPLEVIVKNQGDL